MAAAYPGVELSVGRVTPLIPPGIGLGRGVIRLGMFPGSPAVGVDQLRIFPDWASWLRGKRAYRFHARLHGGQARGRIAASDRDGGWQTSGRFEGIYLSLALSGRLEGRLSYSGPGPTGAPGATGTARLRIIQGKLPLAEPFFGLSEIPFQELTAELTLEKNVLDIKALRLSGPALEAEMTGKILLAPDSRRILLEIRGQIRPFGEFFQTQARVLRPYLNNGALSFTLSGTLTAPVLRLT